MEHHKNCITAHNGPCNCADLETIRVCTDCHAMVEEKFAGDEGLTVCTGCGNIEQGTEEWSSERFEEEGYIV